MIGCDITKIERFEKYTNDEKFLNKYFSKNEQEYILKKQNKAQTLAGLYACKEAVLKAFQIGIGNGIALVDVEISHNEFSAPVVVLNEKLKALLEKIKKQIVSISISHDDDYAFAVCMVE